MSEFNRLSSRRDFSINSDLSSNRILVTSSVDENNDFFELCVAGESFPVDDQQSNLSDRISYYS
jgi:hypothetical protein